MNQHFVSVIIPAYNCADFIGTAIRSVLSQTYEKYEIIVVNDKSSDSTAEVVNTFGNQVKLINHPVNMGAAAARNTGAAHSRGKIIAYLDGDDFWHNRKLEKFITAFQRYEGLAFAVSDFVKYDNVLGKYEALSNSQVFPMIYEAISSDYYHDEKFFKISKEKMFELLLKGYPIFPSSIALRKELLEKNGSWREDTILNEDFDLALRSTRRTDFIYVDESLTTVVRHGSNTSADVIKHEERDVGIINKHLVSGEYNKKEIRLMKYYRGLRFCRLGYNYFNSGNIRKARHMYFLAGMCPRWTIYAVSRLTFSHFVRISRGRTK